MELLLFGQLVMMVNLEDGKYHRQVQETCRNKAF